MALPANGTAWPPAELAPILAKYREYDSWTSNNLAALSEIYGKGTANRLGVVQKIRTWFLGAKASGQVENNTIHVSLAQEITRTSANLLYSEPAQATVVPATEGGNVDTAQERLDLIAGPDFEQTMISAAEVSSGLGGVFLRTTWDVSTRDHVFISKVDPDMAWPEFRWGQLVAVTFWRTVKTENTVVWRHLERHELNAEGIGVIVHGLYVGTAQNLGQAHPFEDHEATAWLTKQGEALIDGNTISTLTPGLGAVYAPNILPSSLWRHDPLGANLGRSDLEGIEQKLDALDELYSSWLRDIRLGKGRLIVGESMLRDLGAGLGAGFDLDQTIFTPVKAAPSSAGSEKMAIEKVQFDIRTEDFLAAIDHFRRIILAAAGYSPSTFGLTDDGAAMTATEVAARQQLSFTTRKRKILGLKPAEEQILSKALAVDAVIFPGKGAEPLAVTVEFPDGVQDDPKAIAEANQLDYNSQSSSIEERVRKRNPDWDDVKVGEEVARIKDEYGLAPLEDPGTFGTDGAGVIPTSPFGGTA
jgi:A118 family predicted phage portal protein